MPAWSSRAPGNAAGRSESPGQLRRSGHAGRRPGTCARRAVARLPKVGEVCAPKSAKALSSPSHLRLAHARARRPALDTRKGRAQALQSPGASLRGRPRFPDYRRSAYPVTSGWGSTVRPVPRPDFPRTIMEFRERFASEAACLRYLAASRWPEGFVCPACGGRSAWVLERRRLWERAACAQQTSVTAGKTRTPLRNWFWAAYLVATHHPGISARQLRRQLGLRRYETAWLILQKLRRAMVAPEREPLRGVVEIEEFYLGGLEEGRRGGRQRGDKALCGIAIEVRGAGSGRLRLAVLADASGDSLGPFAKVTTARGAIVHACGEPRRAFPHPPESGRARTRASCTTRRGGDLRGLSSPRRLVRWCWRSAGSCWFWPASGQAHSIGWAPPPGPAPRSSAASTSLVSEGIVARVRPRVLSALSGQAPRRR